MAAVLFLLITGLFIVFVTGPRAAEPDEPVDSLWFGMDAAGEVTVDVYFFWSETCPHCRRAADFLEDARAELSWLRLHAHEITGSPANAELFGLMARAAGRDARYVPTVIVCGVMVTGFDRAETTGLEIRSLSAACRDRARRVLLAGPAKPSSEPLAESSPAPAGEDRVEVPLLGTITADRYALPVLTVILAGLDAFNPCAFFVLLFLLSLLVHAGSRARMALVGGVFVFISGLAYFVFMAAWLNLFVLVGHMPWITTAAGLIAVAVGLLNIKDFVWLGAGVSLSIPESAKPRLFERMRGVVAGSSLPVMLTGTIALAIAANTYELLCTAGFPMVFTRALTLHPLTPAAHYLYLAAYNLIYVIPLLLIVVGFTLTLGARKLGEREGRVLKLVSGLMMLELGVVLIFVPNLMANLWVAIALIGLALGTAAAVVWVQGLIAKGHTAAP